MRKTAITILLMLAAVAGYAQTAYDGLLFSENNYEGTARSVAMGNAFTALGGDLGSITINPAGSAVAGYSQFTITPSLTFSTSTAQGVSPFADGSLPYFERKMKSNLTSFGMPNLGLTMNYETGRKSGLKNVILGFVVNKTADFNQDVYASGRNSTTSFMGAMAVEADGYLASDLEASDAYNNVPWTTVLAYRSGMISTFGGYDDRYVGASELVFDNGDIVLGGEIEQKYGRRVSGSKNDYVFNLGANVSDFLYVGVNFGISSLSYYYTDYFNETAVDPSDFKIALVDGKNIHFQQMKYSYSYEAEGSGGYAKFGAILTPGHGLRFGAAVQTPIVNTIVENWQYSGNTYYVENGYSDGNTTPRGEYQYSFIAPFRANLGAAYTIGQFGVISADYEYCDYSQMQFKSSYYDMYEFADVNSAIKEIFGPQHMWRFGGEARLGALSLRAGYGFMTSPEKHFQGTYKSNFSFGFGYSSKNSFYADFAVRKNTWNNEYYMPYSDYIFDDEGYILEPVPEILITRSDWKALLTFGWRF